MIKEKKSSSDKLKVLVITTEYGRNIKGGLGRVVNGVFNTISQDIVLDIFLIKLPFPGLIDPLHEYTQEDKIVFAYVYRKDEQNKAKRLYSGEYKNILNTALQQEKYDAVNILCNGEPLYECAKVLKTEYPQVKFIYSCHSISKHEIDIRNNNSDELIWEDYMINQADHIQVLNKTSLLYLKKSYALVDETKKISIIPNGIEETEYTSIDREFKNDIIKQVEPDKNILVVCLSRWSFGKGLEYLIDAIPKIIIKKNNVKFIIAGRKLQSWENKVEEYVEMIDKKIENVKEHVISLGWLNDQQRNAIFSIADICVMPSLIEYFPYGILEPMVCKVSIISSRIETVTEMIEDNKEGLFFSPADSNELAEKIIYLTESKEKREKLAKNAYMKVKDKYQWKAISDKYVNMYQIS